MTQISRAALAACAALALPLAACQKQPEDAFGQKVRAYLLEHPEVIEEAVVKLQQNKQAQAQEAAKASLAKFRQQLERDPRDFVANPDGKITVVEFFDYRCGYCKASAPEVLKLIRDNPDVRFVFKDWPILDRGEDVTSQYAARAALAAHQQGKYLAVYDSLMAERALDRASIDRILADNGVDMARANAAISAPEMTRHVTDIHAAAAALGLQGTPTFFINGVRIPGGIAPRVLDYIIEYELGKAAAVK